MAQSWTSLLPLETERLVLRQPHFDDVPRLVRLAADPAIARNLRQMPFPLTAAHASALVGDALASNLSGGGLVMAVARKAEPASLIGMISFATGSRGIETGYWLGAHFRGKGLLQEALRAELAMIWSKPGVPAVWAGVFADNPASLHILQKLGFSVVEEQDEPSFARQGPQKHLWLSCPRPLENTEPA